MMVKNKRTGRVVLVAGGLTLLAGGVAFAFWTAGGSGTGEATAGSTVPITANQTSTVADMGPGLPAQTLSGTFTNTNTSPVYVASVVAEIGTITQGPVTGGPACTAGDFTLVGETMIVGLEVPVGEETGAWSGATIVFNNTAVNQDACQGASVELLYTVN